MAELSAQAKLELMADLAARVASESGGGVLNDALGTIVLGTAAQAGMVYSVGDTPRQCDLAAEVGLGASSPALYQALRNVARRISNSRRAARLRDIRAANGRFDGSGEVVAIGATGLLAIPLDYRRRVLGVLVLLFPTQQPITDEAVQLAQLATDILATGLYAEQQRQREHENADAGAEGLLAASVAHDLSGPVGALSLQLEEQQRLLEELLVFAGPTDTPLGVTVAEMAELTRDIDAVVDRIRRVLQHMSQASGADGRPEALDIGELLRQATSILRPELERRAIQLNLRTRGGCFVMGRREPLGQVIRNLIMLAAEASTSGEQRTVWVELSGDDEQVTLAVEDSRPSQEEPPRMFDAAQPVGLKVCSAVVADHGGHIEVGGALHGGHRLTVWLPQVDDSSGVHPVAALHDSGVTTASKNIFVIDDDEVFARTMRRALKPQQVRTAVSASEAEITLLDPSYTPDLVLCDINLPGTNGHVLHERLSQRRPEIAEHFVFITGGALGKAEADYVKRTGQPTLFKPLDVRDIVDYLRPEVWRQPRGHGVRTLSAGPEGQRNDHGGPAGAGGSSLPPR